MTTNHNNSHGVASATPPLPPRSGVRPVFALRHSGVSAGGGFGKSRTAAQALHLLYAKHKASLFSSGMYWVTVESVATVERDVRAMALQIPSLSKATADSSTLSGDELMAAVARWLRHRDRRGWLLVLDNADDRQVLSWVVSALLPPLGHADVRGHVVVTSRLSVRELGLVMPGIVAQTVEALPAAEAEKLLWAGAYGSDASGVEVELARRGVSRAAEDTAIKAVAGPCGVAGLPLALAHAAAAVRAGTTYVSFVSYMSALQEKHTALFADGSAVVPSATPVREWVHSQRPPWPIRMAADVLETLEANYLDDFGSVKQVYDKWALPTLGLRPSALAAVRTAVELASDAGRRCVATTFELSMNQASEDAREVMRLLSVTSAENVPMALLESAAEHLPGFRGRDAMRAALLELDRLSLVTLEDDGSSVSAHRLLQRVVRDSIRGLGTMYGDAVVAATVHCVPDPDDDYLAAPAWLPWLPHVEAVVWVVDAGVGVFVSPEVACTGVVDAVVKGVRGHLLLGSLVTARSWLSRVPHEVDELRRAAVVYCYGVLSLLEGSYEVALQRLEEALSLRQGQLAPPHALVAASLHMVGTVLNQTGRHQEALGKHEEALAIRRSCLPSVHPSIATTLDGIGQALTEMDRHEEALAKYEESLCIRKACLASEHPSVATSLSNIGTVLNTMQQNKGALANHEQALATFKACLPPGHPHTAISLNNVAATLRNLGRYEEALARYEEALHINEECLPAGHVNIAIVLGGSGFVLHKLGRHAEALDKMQKALTMFQAKLPPTHAYTTVTLTRLGFVFSALGRDEEAAAATAASQSLRRQRGSSE